MKPRTTFTAMFFAGIAVGWIMGLSVSPVTQTVLGAMVTVLASAAAIFVGIRPASLGKLAEPEPAPRPPPPDEPGASPDKPRPLPNVHPIAALLVGTALGAAAGIWARTHNLLSPSPEAQVSEWVEASGLPKEEVARVLLGGTPVPGTGVLHTEPVPGTDAMPANACFEVNSALRAGDHKALLTALQLWWPAIRDAIGAQPADARTLQVLANVLCPAPPPP